MVSSAVVVTVHLEHLRHNLRALRMRRPLLMPVIKADAYGHGVEAVARVLAEEGIDHMAVGTVEEGALLRSKGHDAFLLALLGPTCDADAALAAACRVAPLVHDAESLARCAAQVRRVAPASPLPVAVKFDTGMSRLGFPAEDAPAVAEWLRGAPEVEPVLVMSHLAASDDPGYDAFTREQVARFGRAAAAMRAVFPGIKTSLTNSPGLLVWPDCAGDLARPGLALYGGNPLHGTERAELGAGLLPVMEVTAPVLSVREVARGAPVGYGCAFRAPRAMRVAVVGAGYADGYPRAVSNRAAVVIRGERAPIVGRVCMQMCMADVTRIPEAAPGDAACLLGGRGPHAVRPEELAHWWGTVPYEVFCMLGRNRRRASDPSENGRHRRLLPGVPRESW